MAATRKAKAAEEEEEEKTRRVVSSPEVRPLLKPRPPLKTNFFSTPNAHATAPHPRFLQRRIKRTT